MNRRNLILLLVGVLIVAGGAGYYFWRQGQETNITGGAEAASQENGSFFDTFFDELKPSDKPSDKPKQPSLKEYKDPAEIFSISYPSSWVVRSEKGRLLQGASLTPPELLSKYSPEEQQFVKGLVVAAAESDKNSQDYYNDLVAGSETGQTEVKNLTINGYPAYMAKGEIRGISYTIYIISHNNRIVYFNYRTKEEESARQNDIGKAIDFTPHVSDFEAAVNSIKFAN